MDTLGHDPHRRLGPAGPDSNDPEIFDVLADLFIGPDEDASPTPAGSPAGAPAPITPAPVAHGTAAVRCESNAAETGRASIEALVLGPLPGRASAWARQYATGELNRQPGPTAFVRVADHAVTVERFGGPGDPDIGRVAIAHRAESGLETVLGGLRRERASFVVRHLNHDPGPLATDRRLDRVTLLAGTDDASIVHVYRLLKAMHDAREHADSANAPRLRVALCGGSDRAASDARARLISAVDRFLGEAVEIVTGPERVAPIASSLLFDDEIAGRVGDRTPGGAGFETVITALRSDAAVRDPAPARPVREPRLVPAPTESSAEPASSSGPGSSPGPERTPEPGPEPGPRRRPTPRPKLTQQAAHEPGQLQAEEPAAITAASAASADELTPIISGLTPIPAACPTAPDVRLHIDADGTLHLVLEVDGDPARGVGELAAAREWAVEHVDLLRLTPKAGMLTGAVTEHLVTTDPSAARRFLGGERRVHVVTDVAVGDRRQRVCVPLN